MSRPGTLGFPPENRPSSLLPLGAAIPRGAQKLARAGRSEVSSSAWWLHCEPLGATLTLSGFRVAFVPTRRCHQASQLRLSRVGASAAVGPGSLPDPPPRTISLAARASPSPGLSPRPARGQEAAGPRPAPASSPGPAPPLPVPALGPALGVASGRRRSRRKGARSRRTPPARLSDPRPRPAPRPRPQAAPPSARPEAPGPRAARGLSAQQLRESLGRRPGATAAVASSGPGKIWGRRAAARGGGTHGGARGAGPGPGVGGRRPPAGAAGAEGGPAPRWVPAPSGCPREGGPRGDPEVLAPFRAWPRRRQERGDPGGSGCGGPSTSPPGRPSSEFASGPLELSCRLCGPGAARLRPGSPRGPRTGVGSPLPDRENVQRATMGPSDHWAGGIPKRAAPTQTHRTFQRKRV